MFRIAQRLLGRFADVKHVQKAVLPELKYGYGDLEPAISKAQLELHHKKHHQTYVTNLNNAVDQYHEAEAKGDVEKLATLANTIKFNLGGHLNHSIYWDNLAPTSKGGGKFLPDDSPLTKQIKLQWGSYEKLIEEFTKKTAPIQGSGWGWLALDVSAKSLQIVELPNQETLGPKGLVPILTVDVWEHAYYVDYKNVRLDYIKQIWQVVNWKDAERRFLAASQK